MSDEVHEFDDDEYDEALEYLDKESEKRYESAQIVTLFGNIEVYTSFDDEEGYWITEDTGMNALEMTHCLRSAMKEHFNRVIFLMEEYGLIAREREPS